MPQGVETSRGVTKVSWEEADSIDEISHAERISQSAKSVWLPWLLVVVGLCLIVRLGVMTWSFYGAIQAMEPTSDQTTDRDLPSLISISPSLALDPAMNARASNSTFSDTSYPDRHIVVWTSPLPRRHDVALGVIGLIVTLIGVRRLVRGSRQHVASLDRGTRYPDKSMTPAIGRAATGIWGFAETLIVGLLVLFLAMFAYQFLVSLIGGTTASWGLVDRTIDQVVSIALLGIIVP